MVAMYMQQNLKYNPIIWSNNCQPHIYNVVLNKCFSAAFIKYDDQNQGIQSHGFLTM